MLIRIEAPHFVAGVEVEPLPFLQDHYEDHHVVSKAAPIVKYMVGWTKTAVIQYCKKKGWKCEVTEGGKE